MSRKPYPLSHDCSGKGIWYSGINCYLIARDSLIRAPFSQNKFPWSPGVWINDLHCKTLLGHTLCFICFYVKTKKMTNVMIIMDVIIWYIPTLCSFIIACVRYMLYIAQQVCKITSLLKFPFQLLNVDNNLRSIYPICDMSVNTQWEQYSDIIYPYLNTIINKSFPTLPQNIAPESLCQHWNMWALHVNFHACINRGSPSKKWKPLNRMIIMNFLSFLGINLPPNLKDIPKPSHGRVFSEKVHSVLEV